MLSIPIVKLLNDFEAMGKLNQGFIFYANFTYPSYLIPSFVLLKGYGLLTLKDQECHVLNNAKGIEKGVVGTVGAGTGLGMLFSFFIFEWSLNKWHELTGECLLTCDPIRGQYHCWPNEGVIIRIDKNFNLDYKNVHFTI